MLTEIKIKPYILITILSLFKREIQRVVLVSTIKGN